ncbi:unnamed protein product [Scytosiphon promiscuus]
MVEVEVVDDGQEIDTGGGWEAELASQRDVALAMARQLSQQLDSQRQTLERRAKTAEALRETSRKECVESLDNRNRRNRGSEVHVRLAGLVGGSLSAWLLCVALGVAWAPLASLALGLPCTLVMAALCSKHVQQPNVKRRSD